MKESTKKSIACFIFIFIVISFTIGFFVKNHREEKQLSNLFNQKQQCYNDYDNCHHQTKEDCWADLYICVNTIQGEIFERW